MSSDARTDDEPIRPRRIVPPGEVGDDSLPGSAEGLIAATLALMTGYAEHCPAPTRGGANPAPADSRPEVAHLLAAKAAANLAFLAEQPGLSAALRCLVNHLRGHWRALEFRGAPGAATHCRAGVDAPVAPAMLCFSRSTARH